jgi:16S rRNA (guanine(966)-N(2))-methyltransferase RsmD
MLRIQSGTVKKAKIKVNRETTRPLTNIAKSAIFSILVDRIVESEVLDLYAGSGALGIESLSRGAKSVEFVEFSKKAADIIKENVFKLRFDGRSQVYNMPAEIYIRKNKGKKYFNIVYIFQPYDATNEDIASQSSKILSQDGIIIFERESKRPPKEVKNLKIVDVRKYGKVGLTFYQKKNTIV